MSQKHALIVDDNVQNVKVLVQLLTKQGVACTEVSDSNKLDDVLSGEQHVDVAFLDLEMPGLDGYKVKDMVRSGMGDIPIIAYTVHVSEINTVRQAGFDGFLSKPLDNVRFPDQLARILRGESVWERA